MNGLDYSRHDGEAAITMMDDIADLYIDAHSGNPGEEDELFSRPSFISRTGSQARKPGFELVTATSDGALTGFSFGYPIPAGQWWSECTPPPRDVLDSAKFAVIELDVRQGLRGQGVGKRLLGTLLDGRAEKFATLAATPGSPAHAMYLRWGWSTAGEFCTPPVMDAMIIALRG
jgi:GNAT superfamily N-acetyltransferase